MSNLENKFSDALVKALENPASVRHEKSLTKIIVEKWNEIQKVRSDGGTYKQIAASLSIKYGYFMTCVYRAKKNVEKKSTPIGNKEIPIEKPRFVNHNHSANNDIHKKTDTQSLTGPGLPKKIVGKSDKSFPNR